MWLHLALIAVNNLLVTNVRRNGDPMETVLSVQWSAPSKANATNALSYRAVVSNDTTEKTTSTTNVSFSGRSPGTSYVVSVYTSALRDPNHDTKTRTETTSPASASIYTSKCCMRGRGICTFLHCYITLYIAARLVLQNELMVLCL